MVLRRVQLLFLAASKFVENVYFLYSLVKHKCVYFQSLDSRTHCMMWATVADMHEKHVRSIAIVECCFMVSSHASRLQNKDSVHRACVHLCEIIWSFGTVLGVGRPLWFCDLWEQPEAKSSWIPNTHVALSNKSQWNNRRWPNTTSVNQPRCIK